MRRLLCSRLSTQCSGREEALHPLILHAPRVKVNHNQCILVTRIMSPALAQLDAHFDVYVKVLYVLFHFSFQIGTI